MKLVHAVALRLPRERVWAFLQDIPRVATCVPGVDEVRDLGGDRYGGTLNVAMGPVRLALAGEVAVRARDSAASSLTLQVSAADAKAGGSVAAEVRIALLGDAETKVEVTSDVRIMGRIGEFGQPLIKRKADQTMAEFARRLERAMTEVAA